MSLSAGKRISSFVFFGNYFYGLCAAALCIEASLQQYFPLNAPVFYLLVFIATVLYYDVAYIGESAAYPANERSLWYRNNNKVVRISMMALLAIFMLSAYLYLNKIQASLYHLSLFSWLLILVFPLSAGLYYGSSGRYNLRKIGWLKPFVIGFSWAGMVTIYPVLFYCIRHGMSYEIKLITILLFIKNFMFISLLCILFDIKDYATDYNKELKTFVVKFGLRRTIFYIIIPLSIVGLGTFLTYGFTRGFSLPKILLNTIPFLSLVAVAYSLHRRRNILYYLIIIDGLMLLKALCGTIAMTFF